MDSIKNIIPQVIGNISQRRSDDKGRLDGIWQGVLKAQELGHTELAGIKDDKILVWVDSPAVLYQMKIRKPKILECLQRDLPDLRNIDFKIGKVR